MGSSTSSSSHSLMAAGKKFMMFQIHQKSVKKTCKHSRIIWISHPPSLKIEPFGSLYYMAAPPSWISDSIHVFWVGSNTNLSEQFSYYISSAAFLLTFIKDNLILPLNVSSQLLIKFNVSEIWPCTTMMMNNHHHHPHKPPPAHPTVCVFAKIYSTFCRRAVSDWPIPWLHDFI